MVAKRTPPQKRGEVVGCIEALLLSGESYEFDAQGQPIAIPTEPELQATWERRGKKLTERYIRENPCCRPWAWWRWSCPVPSPYRWFLRVYGSPAGIPARNQTRIPDQQQREFLEKHGLLTPEEIAAAVVAAECE